MPTTTKYGTSKVRTYAGRAPTARRGKFPVKKPFDEAKAFQKGLTALGISDTAKEIITALSSAISEGKHVYASAAELWIAPSLSTEWDTVEPVWDDITLLLQRFNPSKYDAIANAMSIIADDIRAELHIPDEMVVSVDLSVDDDPQRYHDELRSTENPMMALRTLSVDNYDSTIEGESFSRFLDIMFNRSEYFSLSRLIFRDTEEAPTELQRELRPYSVVGIVPSRWYGYGPIPDGPTPASYARALNVHGSVMCRTIYEANDETKAILASHWTGIFPSSGPMEDLCFWADRDTMLLGSVTHEAFCSTNNLDDDLRDALLDIGCWKPIEQDIFGIQKLKISHVR